jgi:phage tail-like protein
MPRPPDVHGSHYELTIDDVVVGYFTECSGLSAEYETYPYAEGGQNLFVHQLRGRVKYANIVLKRGVTASRDLLNWFQENKERSSRGGLTIKLLNRDLKVVQTWAFSCAVPVRYTAPSVSSDATSMAIETLEIAHEGLTPGVS